LFFHTTNINLQDQPQSLIQVARAKLNLSVRFDHHILKLTRTVVDLVGGKYPALAFDRGIAVSPKAAHDTT